MVAITLGGPADGNNVLLADAIVFDSAGTAPSPTPDPRAAQLWGVYQRAFRTLRGYLNGALTATDLRNAQNQIQAELQAYATDFTSQPANVQQAARALHDIQRQINNALAAPGSTTDQSLSSPYPYTQRFNRVRFGQEITQTYLGRQNGTPTWGLRLGDDPTPVFTSIRPITVADFRAPAGPVQRALTRAGEARGLTVPSTGAAQAVAPDRAATSYGEPRLLQTFQSNRWRDNEFAVYQVQNRATGNWEVRARSLRDNRRNPDLLVYTSNRPVIAADFNRTGPLLPKLSETIRALNAPANVLPSQGRATTGNAWDVIVGAGSAVLSSLPRVIAGIPEGLGRNVAAIGGNLLDLAERGLDHFHPADLSRKGFSNPIREEQRNQFAETNNGADAVAKLQRAFAQAMGADPTSFGFQAGDFVGPYLLLAASAARGARTGGRQPGLSRQGPDQALRGEFRTRVRTASLDELVSCVRRLMPKQIEKLRTHFPEEYRALTNRLAQFNDPQAASLLARLRGEGIVATGTSGTAGAAGTPPRNVTPTASTPPPSSSSAIVHTGTPTVPPTVPRTPPVETLVARFLGNLSREQATALRPRVQERVAGQTPDQALRTLNDLANNPAAVQALYTEAALAQANSAADSMAVNGKTPRLYPPGQEQAATAEAFAANSAGDVDRAANQPGEVSVAFKIRTDAGVEVPAVFTGSPAEASALLRSRAFNHPSAGGQPRAYVPEGFAREGGRTLDAINDLVQWRPTTPTARTATTAPTGGNTSPVRTPPETSVTPPKEVRTVNSVIDGQGYRPQGVFMVWMGPAPIPAQGFKLHVSAPYQDTGRVAEIVLPALRDHGISHKVVANAELYETRMTGTQVGKFITIYPRNDQEAAAIAKLIDDALIQHGVSGMPKIPGEKTLGKSGAVFTRYGQFTKEHPGLVRPDGKIERDVRGSAWKPDWVNDPFQKYGL